MLRGFSKAQQHSALLFHRNGLTPASQKYARLDNTSEAPPISPTLKNPIQDVHNKITEPVWLPMKVHQNNTINERV